MEPEAASNTTSCPTIQNFDAETFVAVHTTSNRTKKKKMVVTKPKAKIIGSQGTALCKHAVHSYAVECGFNFAISEEISTKKFKKRHKKWYLTTVNGELTFRNVLKTDEERKEISKARVVESLKPVLCQHEDASYQKECQLNEALRVTMSERTKKKPKKEKKESGVSTVRKDDSIKHAVMLKEPSNYRFEMRLLNDLWQKTKTTKLWRHQMRARVFLSDILGGSSGSRGRLFCTIWDLITGREPARISVSMITPGIKAIENKQEYATILQLRHLTLTANANNNCFEGSQSSLDSVRKVVRRARRSNDYATIELIEEYLIERMIWDSLCLKVHNLSAVLSNNYLKTLKEACWTEIELSIEGFNQLQLTTRFLLQLVQRENRLVSEMNLFKMIARKFRSFSTAEREKLIANIRFTYMPTTQVYDIVQRFQLFSEDRIPNCNDVPTIPRRNLRQIAKLSASSDHSMLIDLNTNYLFNTIKLTLPRKMVCGYTIETSADQLKWYRLVDYRKSNCHGRQYLQFAEVVARHVRIRAMYCKKNGKNIRKFSFRSLRIYHEERTTKVYAGSYEPLTGVKARAFIVDYKDKEYVRLKNVDRILRPPISVCRFITKRLSSQYEFHKIVKDQNHGFLIVFRQPYIIDSFTFHLWNNDGREYWYNVQLLIDGVLTKFVYHERHGTRSEQTVRIRPQLINGVFIKGWYCSTGDEFRMISFQAPAHTLRTPRGATRVNFRMFGEQYFFYFFHALFLWIVGLLIVGFLVLYYFMWSGEGTPSTELMAGNSTNISLYFE